MTNNNAQRLAAYRKRLEEGGFKRVSAYVSLDLVAYLQSQNAPGECIGRTLERLLLGSAKERPRYYSDEEMVRKEARRRERVTQRAQVRKAIRVEQRALRRAEWERLRQEAMERIGLLRKPET
ncbi:hypothetical protein [Pollutimonas sp. M17]|uniref:hypothetical protein n=1 Tax=Pollutimonas sp. M17 TaxID=2962065 RepID=UPI0021F4E079|nr:hypothetical protein [Pollutimonas sp. M17]UYO95042.1 hypothetical protein OEG81_06965 [Pollutimonas sp. M17]